MGLEELVYTQARMKEWWALGLESKEKAEQEYEPLITFSPKSWYNHKAWLAHSKIDFVISTIVTRASLSLYQSSLSWANAWAISSYMCTSLMAMMASNSVTLACRASARTLHSTSEAT